MRPSSSPASPLLVIASSVVAAEIALFACSREESMSPAPISAAGGGPATGTGAPSGSGAGGIGGGGRDASASGGGGRDASASGGGGSDAGGGGGAGTPAAGLNCSPPGEDDDEAPLKLTPVVAGLQFPLLVKSAPGDPTRLFIVTQSGRILVLDEGAAEPATFLDIEDLVMFTGGNGERGLLGLAFHPDYASNGRFFVHYSDKATGGDTRVVEYRRGERPDVADPAPVATYLEQAQPQRNHNGGSIEFSPADGFLYLGLGDGGSDNDQGPGHAPNGNGQALSTLLGKIVRVDVSTHPYGIPEGNMTGEGVLPEIWDHGLRNPYRFSFDACTGALYIADVGQARWEEINIEPAGQGRKNYGWRLMEGAHCFTPAVNCDPEGALTLPAAEYAHAGRIIEDCSVTGGYVYRGSRIPWLRGSYFYGDFCSGRIWTLTYENGATSAPVDRTDDLGSFEFSISSFGQDGNGEVYVVDFGGTVYRIDPE
ncbi:PQQ-dependent sugar dehydrogenase [Sorangium sp. So ce233]|uniref:PQQ-dependent sugar dehydrogenase n=1 Tax=Sorangium sp. So ce233 TaxID=3133290 RepID=UPI003F63CCAE